MPYKNYWFAFLTSTCLPFTANPFSPNTYTEKWTSDNRGQKYNYCDKKKTKTKTKQNKKQKTKNKKQKTKTKQKQKKTHNNYLCDNQDG